MIGLHGVYIEGRKVAEWYSAGDGGFVVNFYPNDEETNIATLKSIQGILRTYKENKE